LIRRVGRTIRVRRLLDPGDRVLAAVSGGSDSVALLFILKMLEPDAPWSLAGVVHVHHGLRPGDADEDEGFCRALAARLDLPIEVAHVDVAARAAGRRQSREAAARVLRYEAFEAAAGALSATRVVTGHTRDDQAETVLLRLLRGTGTRGLSGVRARRGLYARPLLDCDRAALRAFLAERDEPFRDDRSNLDETIPRNRIRHTLLPRLAAEWPGAAAALARTAELAADDEAFLARTAAEIAPALSLSGADGVQLDVRGLAPLPAALSRRIVRHALEQAGGTPRLSDVEAVRSLARAARPDGRLMLRGVAVWRQGPILRLARPTSREGTPPFSRRLDVPGEVHVPETGVHISASVSTGAEDGDGLGSDTKATLRADAITLPLTVRNRRPGDRFHPLGAPGTRKLQDVFVDRKVPRGERDRVPIVVDAEGRIVWVAGLGIAESCRLTRPLADVVTLKLKKDIR
jgi:tRNA(Ile)-lysidine synthase